jgi:heme-degrading monooxygenase HmoA
MILEMAMLQIIKGEENHFERDFAIASQFIASIPFVEHYEMIFGT